MKETFKSVTDRVEDKNVEQVANQDLAATLIVFVFNHRRHDRDEAAVASPNSSQSKARFFHNF